MATSSFDAKFVIEDPKEVEKFLTALGYLEDEPTNNKVTITYTSDEHDCETCGSTFAESYILECNGKTYGEAARANCFDSVEYTADQVLCMFLEDIGYEVYWTSEDIEDDFKE